MGKRLLKLLLYAVGAFVAILAAVFVVALVKVVTGPSVPRAAMTTARAARTVEPPRPTAQAAPVEPAPSAEARHWYEGGTLSGAGALEWQKATDANKLATCADMLAFLWDKGKLTPKVAAHVQSIDDLKGPATELMGGINNALAGDPDPVQNQKMLANQKVADVAATVMALAGWIRP